MAEETKETKATKPLSVQDEFLNKARKEKTLLTVHLMNGFQIKGFVRSYDQFTVVVETMGRQQLIFKHAISTISPSKPTVGAAAAKPAVKAETEDE